MAELRSAIFIDQLQPQTMCYLGTWIRGRLPRSGMAAAVIEVAPGLDIEPLTDVAVKHTRLQAGILVVERQFGYLEFHSRSPSAVRSASAAVLEALGASPADATRPAILASTLVSRLDHQHAFLINRNKLGSMALAGESLFVLEMQPASYAILAVNEAEKAARIKVVDYRMIGATGRVYLTGEESDVRAASEAATGGAGGGRMSERDAAREILRELLHEALAGSQRQRDRRHVPQIPAPPVAAVLRPSTWTAPAGRRRGDRGPAPRDGGVESVTLDSDEDLDRFVRTLLARFENPGDREAIRAGRLRFTLSRGAASARAGRVRVERGAVTERKVEEAAKAGARLVLGPGAVLTPLARDKARAKGIEIERER